LQDVMQRSIHCDTRRRLLAGAGVLVFVAVFFAMPLYAAATLCTMPCCAHDHSATSAVAADMAACATDCLVQSDEATAASSLRFVAPESRVIHLHSPAPVVLLTASANEGSSLAPDVGLSHSPCSAPVHLLNSVFRI
jgi:hypothetical protein